MMPSNQGVRAGVLQARPAFPLPDFTLSKQKTQRKEHIISTHTNAFTAPVVGGAIGTLVLYILETYVARADFPLAVDGAIFTLCIFLMSLAIPAEAGP
jgi:hypothetical protein